MYALGILHTPQKCKINMLVYTILMMYFLSVLEKGEKFHQLQTTIFVFISFQFDINRYLNLVTMYRRNFHHTLLHIDFDI